MDKIKLFFLNWKTSVPASLALVCESLANFTSVIPEKYMMAAHSICTTLLALGVIAAKDADKTHSKVIVQPQPEPVTVPVEGEDKSKVVSSLAVLFTMAVLGGCASTKGTMLDGRLCTIASSDAAQQDVKTIVDSYVDPNDKAKADLYLSTAKLSATALCEAARARQAVQAQGG